MFAETVATLSKADPTVIFRDLHKLFTQITKMGPDEVVVAYQTLDMCAAINGSEGDPVVMRVKEALRQQMLNLMNNDPYGHVRRRFDQVMMP